jgi:hypothetical protein
LIRSNIPGTPLSGKAMKRAPSRAGHDREPEVTRRKAHPPSRTIVLVLMGQLRPGTVRQSVGPGPAPAPARPRPGPCPATRPSRPAAPSTVPGPPPATTGSPR